MLWIMILGLIVLAILARIVLRSWLAPGAFFALYWTVAAVLPLIALPNDLVTPGVCGWILLSALAVFMGNVVILGRGRRVVSRIGKNARAFNENTLWYLVLLSTLFGSIGVILVIVGEGYSLKSLFKLDQLVSMANAFSVGRYSGTYTTSPIAQALTSFCYLAALFAGAMAASGLSRGRYPYRSLIAFLPTFVFVIATTQRGAAILSIFLFISSFISVRCFLGDDRLFTRVRVLVFVLSSMSIFLFFSMMGLFRAGDTDFGRLADLFIPKVFSGAFGYLAVFTNWFESVMRGVSSDPLLGRTTFAGLSNALGLYERQLGLYPEMVLLSTGYPNNLYTLFRILIEDFTPIGSLAFLFFVGIGSGICFEQVRFGKSHWLLPLIAYYTTVLYSFVVSIWVWTSTFLVFLIALPCFLMVCQITNKPAILKTKTIKRC